MSDNNTNVNNNENNDNFVTESKWVLNLLNALQYEYNITLILSFLVISLIGAIMLKLNHIHIFISILSATLADSLHAYILENIRKTEKYAKIENDNVLLFSFIVMFVIHFLVSVSAVFLNKFLC